MVNLLLASFLTLISISSVVIQNEKNDLIKFSISNPLQKSFPFLQIADKRPLEGETVFVIDKPKGLEFTVSTGIVSSVRKDGAFGQIIQTSIRMFKGNSGSPLINANGEVIGIASRSLMKGQDLVSATSLSNLYLLNLIDRLKLHTMNLDKTIVEDNTFKRFEWETSLSTVLRKETLSLEEKKSNSLKYLADFAGIGIEIKYDFDYNGLNKIWISPRNYLIKEKRQYTDGVVNINTPGRTTDLELALSDYLIMADELQEILSDYKDQYEIWFQVDDKSGNEIDIDHGNITDNINYCLKSNKYKGFTFAYTWRVKSNRTKYTLVFFKYSRKQNGVYPYGWRLDLSKY